jgi:hypothetical protein
MSRTNSITHQELLKILSYNPETGVFIRIARTSSRINIGDIAGTKHHKGYIHIRVNGKKHSAHRLAWFYMYGIWPLAQIDHINGVRDDNRLSNLREATNAQNSQNQKAINSSKLLGAHWHKRDCVWQAKIIKDGKHYYLGSFPTAELAHSAYLIAKASLHTFNPTPLPPTLL